MASKNTTTKLTKKKSAKKEPDNSQVNNLS